jgi:mycothiol synthase
MSPLPAGYAMRPPRRDDVTAIVEMANAESMALRGIELVSAEWIETLLATPSVDVENDVVVVTAPDGAIAGYMFIRSHPPYTRVTAIGVSAIDHHGIGVGGALVDESERRSQRFAALAPPGAAVLMHQGTFVDEPMVAGVLSTRGYRQVRIFCQMRITFDDPPQPPPVPAGVELRLPAAGEEDAVHACLAEGFQDHWGDGIADLDDWRREYVEADTFAPELWTLAWCGTDLAGAVVGVRTTEEDADYGYLAQLAVRPAFRRRGIGEALLRQSLTQFHGAGRRGVVLYVDADSLTGATRLYERAGMTPEPRFATWEKELRPGDHIETGR